MAAHADGTFAVLYDDGDREEAVPADRLRLVGAEAAAPAPVPAPVAAAAAVPAVAPDAAPLVTAAPAAAAGQPAMVKETRVTKVPGKWAVDARVEGNYGGKGEYFPGKVRNMGARGPA